jgi:hypothetical protein
MRPWTQLPQFDAMVGGFDVIAMAAIGGAMTRVFGEENPTPCTLVIVPGSVAITYRTHYKIISFTYNEIRVQNIIFTFETTRYTNLVQAPWAKRQVEILHSGS